VVGENGEELGGTRDWRAVLVAGFGLTAGGIGERGSIMTLVV
jgi:hypothetical protein